MFTVALIGADGSGKSTLGRKLRQMPSLPIKYVYMGVNLESSGLMLPTTRLALEVKRALGGRPDIAVGPPDPSRARPRPRGLVRRALGAMKATLRTTNLIAEEWFRQCVVWYYQARGYIVLFDRHFVFDYCARPSGADAMWQPLSRRLHVAMLEHLYPRPSLVICLDAPAEVLYERKHEGTVELLEIRRQEYLQSAGLVEHFTVVDASQELEAVEREVADVISHFRATRTVKTDRQRGAGPSESNEETVQVSKQPPRRVTSP